jgi:hypothetical protein
LSKPTLIQRGCVYDLFQTLCFSNSLLDPYGDPHPVVSDNFTAEFVSVTEWLVLLCIKNVSLSSVYLKKEEPRMHIWPRNPWYVGSKRWPNYSDIVVVAQAN